MRVKLALVAHDIERNAQRQRDAKRNDQPSSRQIGRCQRLQAERDTLTADGCFERLYGMVKMDAARAIGAFEARELEMAHTCKMPRVG